MEWAVTAKLFAALFAIMNPLSVLPIFLAMTADQSTAGRRSTAFVMMASVVVGSIVCALIGQRLLALFGIDVEHFRLAGGLIVLLIALSMLNGADNTAHNGTEKENAALRTSASTGVGIYPLAIPIALGPGTIATIIVFAQSSEQAGHLVAYYAGLAGYLVFFSAFLVVAPYASAWVSPTALSVTKRLMGLVLAAIAAEMITGALGRLFPGWLHP